MAMAEISQRNTPSSNSILSPTLDQTQWVVQISELVERDDLQTALQIPTSIFKLPDSITKDNPDVYFPRAVALGPYHHFRPELYRTELYKLENAKEAREKLKLPAFSQIVDELRPSELRIRASFDRYLQMGSYTLAWIMAIDALFLLRLLTVDGKEDEHRYWFIQKLEFPLPMFEQQKLYHNINGNLMAQIDIINDILKLENQIPLLVLKEIQPRNLHLLFYQFCFLISPISFDDYALSEIFDQSHHLLHFLYLLIMQPRIDSMVAGMPAATSFFLELLNVLASVFHLQQLSEAIGLIQSLFGLLTRVNTNESSSSEDMPSIIPRASELAKNGVKFKCAADIKSTRFVEEMATLFLPMITLNPFSEVMFRNLVAFEAISKLGHDPAAGFTKFAALMSGLIMAEEDVVMMKKAGILSICSGFGSDEDAVKMFNGVRKSINGNFGRLLESETRQDRAESIESRSDSNSDGKKMVEIMEEIREYYESCWRVKAKRFVEKYICSTLKGFFICIVVLLLIFVIIRTFCSWFSCPKILEK